MATYLDRILDLPTNEAWIDPWVAYLKSRGVRFVMGQAVTGISTLAIGSFLAFAGILAGGVWGVKALERSLGAEDFSI